MYTRRDWLMVTKSTHIQLSERYRANKDLGPTAHPKVPFVTQMQMFQLLHSLKVTAADYRPISAIPYCAEWLKYNRPQTSLPGTLPVSDC